ncbi:nucleotidyl transferase AbiEii/AbiGii toxin family protein [Noviherbaspirillum pedocola]|uniref:Nucleotidyl transferase AbiEii/AbiGii toxin family protein n=1 Tax=Noviherbaspirillum pedocola TaxID=2801341 RepID=A0A934SQE7_9BURK|nr:nucleotidyl transferase AbiEii/AbiGii toxin family protein [Noviherbaspirillum pedocola]MBK4734836.1 nucleotidyl transferase AbiEii/AbiGii toxin family protein [Noviherbaspirillum pedocola]
MSAPSSLPDGPWQILLRHALTLIDEIDRHGRSNPYWTFGGGTVLMLRYQHRLSNDIDLFVPDPQYLGYVSPRLSDVAASICADYEEGAQFIKLSLPEGEIDFVASPNLMPSAVEEWVLFDRPVRVETSTEIVAKKMWHRGDRPTARDLFDLCLVIEREPEALRAAAPFLMRHREVFLREIVAHASPLTSRFAAIRTLRYTPSYERCVALATEFLLSLPHTAMKT